MISQFALRLVSKVEEQLQKWIDKRESQLYEQGDVLLKKLGSTMWEGLVVLTPEIVSVSALVAGGWIMIHPMVSDEPLTKPLGIFAAIFVVGASIMSYAMRGA